jgi:hypothetical protein
LPPPGSRRAWMKASGTDRDQFRYVR